MKRHKSNDKLSMVCLVLALSAAGGYAQTNYYKADNGIKLSLTDSWVGGVVPSAGDRVWFSGNTANRTSQTGIKNYNWVGIVVTNSTYNWTIKGRNVQVDSEGINLAAGNTGNFTLPGVRLRGHQTWNVAEAGSTLIVKGGDYADSSISGDGGYENVTITKTGAGTVELQATSTNWNGNFVVDGGTVLVGADNVFGATGTLFLNDGTLLLGGGKTQTNSVAVSGNVRIDKNCVLAGNLSGDASSSITHEDGSNVAFSLRLGGDNSGFSGTITNNAVLTAENRNSFGTGNLVLNDGSSLSVVSSVSLTGSDALANDIELNGTVMLGASNKGGDMELAGDISGDGGFAMTVMGGYNVEVTLSGTNTYAGATAVTDGSMIINGDNSAVTGTVTVSTNSALGGAGTIGGDVVFEADAKFRFSSNATLTVNGSLVDLGTLGVADMDGLDASVEYGSYALMDGSAAFDFSDVQNIGSSNAYYLGSGKGAYLEENGGLELMVVSQDPAPLNPSVEILPGGTNLVVCWSSESVDSYGIQTTTDLISMPWEPVVSNYPGTGGDLCITGAVTDATRFYRISIEE